MDEKLAIFKEYIDKNDVLVVDKNPSSRSRLLKIMVDLGCKRHMVHTAGTLQEASDLISAKKIGIVLSDYYIGGGSGFDLFKFIREKNPTAKDLSFILVTSNISQTAVAKAAEEDVDSFVIKPYTLQSIQENLISTVCTKVKPSDYVLKIEAGKNFISTGKYDEAMTVLNAAMKLHPRPALALFYIGQAEYLKNSTDKALGSYNKGLAFNNIHYKCLIGLYEILMRDNKFHEGYQVVKKVAQYFPANPDRLTQIVRLAIKTENFEDMQFYYEVFTTLEERTKVLINYIGAGMFVSGKHFLMKKKDAEAIQYFDNIAVSCAEYTKFIRAVITLLIEHNKHEEAEKYIGRFPAGFDQHEDFLVSNYLIQTKKLKNHSTLVKKGLDLYNLKIRDFNCMRAMLHAMEKSGYNEEKLTPYKTEMETLWPDKVSISA